LLLFSVLAVCQGTKMFQLKLFSQSLNQRYLSSKIHWKLFNVITDNVIIQLIWSNWPKLTQSLFMYSLSTKYLVHLLIVIIQLMLWVSRISKVIILSSACCTFKESKITKLRLEQITFIRNLFLISYFLLKRRHIEVDIRLKYIFNWFIWQVVFFMTSIRSFILGSIPTIGTLKHWSPQKRGRLKQVLEILKVIIDKSCNCNHLSRYSSGVSVGTIITK
jgi:hypothetical protein